MDDPLNLMRVMPPKGARVRCRTGDSATRSSAHGFFVSDRINRMDKMTLENVNGEHSVDSVHSVEKPLPNSKKTYVSGKVHREIRVPFREISLAPTKSINGEIEINEAVRVYDTSGPWGDPDFHGDVTQGLPPLRAKWIRERGDVETIAGRVITPLDDGYLSQMHAEHVQRRNGSSKSQDPSSSQTSNLKSQTSNFAARRPLRAKSGKSVTQLYYARQGIITPEMEFIAIRENLGSARGSRAPFGGSPNASSTARNSLGHQHAPTLSCGPASTSLIKSLDQLGSEMPVRSKTRREQLGLSAFCRSEL